MSRSLPVAQTESDPKVPGPTTWPLCPSLWAFFFCHGEVITPWPWIPDMDQAESLIVLCAHPHLRAPQPETISCHICGLLAREEIEKGLGVLLGHEGLNSWNQLVPN